MSQAKKGKTFSDEHRKKLSQACKGKKHTEETRKKISQANNYRKIPVVAIDKNSKVRIFKSQGECARQLNLNPGNIYMCLRGRLKSTGGYTLKKINNKKKRKSILRGTQKKTFTSSKLQKNTCSCYR